MTPRMWRSPHSRAVRRTWAASALMLLASTGCTREFFRNWADQDVTEAIFEKSRDPHFRIDMFTITPPALSRFVDPYDPDRPPAPPDDYVAQELNPQPQYPRHRLMTPAEGTGYLGLLEEWKRRRGPRRPVDVTIDTGPSVGDAAPPPPNSGSPFPRPIEGTGDDLLTPIPEGGPDDLDLPPDDPRRPGADDAPLDDSPLSQNPRKDLDVQLAATQVPSEETEVPGAEGVIPDLESPTTTEEPVVPLEEESPFIEQQSPEQVIGESGGPTDTGRDLIDILKPEAVVFDEASAAGLGQAYEPYLVNGREVLTLALQNSRAYQFRLESLYLAGLAVTLQRFQFTPQVAAGLQPGGPSFGGFAGPNPGTSYVYATQETLNPASLLNIGTLAGVAKAFSFGGSIAGNFANQTVINFGGPNAVQTTSQSFLPLNISLPFLRNGGRAFVLEPLTQAERNLLYEIRSFARFRKEFFTSILAGGGVTNGGPSDPTVGYLPILQLLQAVENNTKNVAAYQRVLEVFLDLSKGAGSTVSPLDLSNVEVNLQSQRAQLLRSSVTYQTQLNFLKQQLGLPPDLPMVPDPELLRGFRTVFDEIEALESKPRPVLEALVDTLPPLEDVVIDGRTVIAYFREAADAIGELRPIRQQITDRTFARRALEQERDRLLETLQAEGINPVTPEQFDENRRRLTQIELELQGINSTLDEADEAEVARLYRAEDDALKQSNEQLEDLLRAADRVALENRLDLMNTRAQLYDAWRQLAVTANQLQGVFNVNLSNQVQTSPTTNNPFAFDSQVKQFSLTLNAELPLIRVQQRNNFVQALINYQRQRRALMQVEDSLKNSIRQQIYNLRQQYQQYEISKTQYVAALVTLDQAFQQFLAPPGAGGGGGNSSGIVLTLLRGLDGVNGAQNSLISTWVQYQTQRIALYRDLGIMPFDEWEAFYELFPAAESRAIGPDGNGARPAPAPSIGPEPGDGLEPIPAPALPGPGVPQAEASGVGGF